MLEKLNTFDWEEAFKYAYKPSGILGEKIKISPVDREDIKKILAIEEGEGDGESWILLAQLYDEKFFFLRAWCDYTGWG